MTSTILSSKQTGTDDVALPARGRLVVLGILAIWMARLVVAAVFLYAAWPKIANPEAFAVSIYRYELLPTTWVNAVAIMLPWLEVVAALALILLPNWRSTAGVMLIVLLVMFSIAIATALARGLEISCGCFSSSESTVSWWNLVRNTGLIGLVLLACAPTCERGDDQPLR